MIISCLCGCKQQFEQFDKRGRKRKYISGHNKSTLGKNSKLKSTCKTCRKVFEFYKSKTEGKFCSKKCQFDFNYPGSYWLGKNGYLYYQKGKKYKVLVHRLNMRAKKGQIIHHKDRNKLNNSLDNLEILPNQSTHIKIHNPIQYRWSPSKHKK